MLESVLGLLAIVFFILWLRSDNKYSEDFFHRYDNAEKAALWKSKCEDVEAKYARVIKELRALVDEADEDDL